MLKVSMVSVSRYERPGVLWGLDRLLVRGCINPQFGKNRGLGRLRVQSQAWVRVRIQMRVSTQSKQICGGSGKLRV